MCGIAGFVWAGALPDAERRIKAMTDVVRHRGPDDEGSFVQRLQRFDYTVALGHRRLAIIDLATGDQPMTDETGRATLVFNGEIYNFHELREELAAFGHRFRTKSDTEVLLQSYLRWGPECVQHFRGMFAFALWDRRCRRLLLARDHFGKKPLYFYHDQQKLLFASEIKAILAATGERSLLDHGSVADYLLYRYVPAPHTLFANVRKSCPGATRSGRTGVGKSDGSTSLPTALSRRGVGTRWAIRFRRSRRPSKTPCGSAWLAMCHTVLSSPGGSIAQPLSL